MTAAKVKTRMRRVRYSNAQQPEIAEQQIVEVDPELVVEYEARGFAIAPPTPIASTPTERVRAIALGEKE